MEALYCSPELSFYRQVWNIGGSCAEAERGGEEDTFVVKVENLRR